jgi:uncharacterized glyoxalase superfamily protein PhnB
MLAISDVAVTVKDAKASAKWWAEKVGFAVHTVGGPEGHAIMVAPPGERFLLHLCEGFEAVDPGNTGIGLVTDEVDDLVERMKAAGVTFTEPLRKLDWGGMAKFADPDGNVFWLLGAPRSIIRAEVGRRAPMASRTASGRRRPRSKPSRSRTSRTRNRGH